MAAIFTIAWVDVAFADPTSAPTALRLTDAIGEAARHNPTLLAAHADVVIADGHLQAAAGADDFLLDGSAGAQSIRSALVAGSPVQEPTQDTVALELDLTRPLPTGGSLGLHAAAGYGTSDFVQGLGNGMSSDTTTITYSPSLQLVYTQPILRGRGSDVARADSRRAREGRESAGSAEAAAAAAAVRDVVIAYWELAFARAELTIRRELASSARDQLEIVKENIRVGKLPPSASAEVEVALGTRDEDVLFSEQNVLDRSLDLRRVAGLEIGADAEIASIDAPGEVAEVPGTADALPRALARNPQLLAARANNRLAAVDVDVTENGLLPQLDVTLSGGPNGSAASASESLSQLVRFDAYTVSAAVVLHEPLGHRLALGNQLAARATLHKARVTEADLESQIRVSVVHLSALAREAKRRVAVIAPTTRSAELDLAAERARFAVGRSTNFDVLRRQDELADTQLRHTRAEIDLLQAMAGLEAATGDILVHYQVKLPAEQP